MASDALRCGAETRSGATCRRKVAAAGERCSQHPVPAVVDGKSLRAAVLADYELSTHELQLLDQVCSTLDTIVTLAEIVEQDGSTTTGSKGQMVLHPAIPEMRAQRLAFARMLAQLRLPVEGGEALASPESVRARTAAQARWRHRDDVDQERAQLRRGETPATSPRRLRAVDPAPA